MNAEQILESEDFKKCVEFHGHICPGLSIGFKAAKIAMDKLKEGRAGNEEIVSIVETDSCFADAVQVITGCTFGKGNFIYRDYGKMALTLLSRKTSQGVRVVMRPRVFAPDESHQALMQKVISGKSSEEETKQFRKLHFKRATDILNMPDDELFIVKAVRVELPSKARIEPSECCSRCGEPTMASKLESVNGMSVCRGCL